MRASTDPPDSPARTRADRYPIPYLARWLMQHRGAYLAAIALVTALLALGLPRVRIGTVFSDLLPLDHPYVHVFREHPGFGSPLTVQILVERRDGETIFNPTTLGKVWRLTAGLHRVPGIDHDRVLSMASEKARVVSVTPAGIVSRPLMEDVPPASAGASEALRARVAGAPGVARLLISPDQRAALIRGTFIEERLSYREAFDALRALARAERDPEHAIHIAGAPMLVGWVLFHEAQMRRVFAVSAVVMLLVLAFYMRNVAGIAAPVLVSAVSAVWGLGFVGWIGHNVDPLIMVVPVLLVARSFSHCMQVTERYCELLHDGAERKHACEGALAALLAPGALGVATDAAAILAIGIAPIPMLQKLALFCGFWALSLLPATVLLAPVLLSYLPRPRNAAVIAGRSRGGVHAAIVALLSRVGAASAPRARGWAAAALGLAALAGIASAAQIRIGGDTEGSGLLWPDSPYNRAVRAIDRHFPGINTLEIILEGKVPFAMRDGDAIRTMHELQRRMEIGAAAPLATLSFADYLPEVNRLYNGGNPKWLPLDYDSDRLQGVINGLLFGANVEHFTHVVDLALRDGTVTVWLGDLKSATLERMLALAASAVRAVGEEHAAFRVRLGSGNAALQQAVNERVATYEVTIAALLSGSMLIACGLAYRSARVGLILVVPVVVANLLLAVCMMALGIGLDVNTLPVTAVGIGVGIDYAIYLLSRLREEHARHRDPAAVVDASVTTTGKAIFFTASTVLLGLLPWYGLSDLKFQADMGLLLALVMVINMVVALVAVPVLVALVGPRAVLAPS